MLRYPLLKYRFTLILAIIGLLMLSFPVVAQDEVPANDVVWPEQ